MSASSPPVPTLWWLCARAFFEPVSRGLYRMRVTGREHVPAQGGLLIVANHVSQKDPPFLAVAAVPRRVHFMAKEELFRVPLLGPLIRSQGAFPVRRGAADRDAIRTARDVLARGDALLMFPEGTRSRDGRLGRPWPGAGALALVPGVTTLPAAIWGTQRPLGPVRVAFGEPVDLSGAGEGPRSLRAQRAVDRIMAAIAILLPAVGGPPGVVAPSAEAPPAAPIDV